MWEDVNRWIIYLNDIKNLKLTGEKYRYTDDKSVFYLYKYEDAVKPYTDRDGAEYMRINKNKKLNWFALDQLHVLIQTSVYLLMAKRSKKYPQLNIWAYIYNPILRGINIPNATYKTQVENFTYYWIII